MQMSKKIETVPNQHIYVVHREPIGKNFISLNKYNYTKAYRDMSKTPAALGLYIWLVGNQDNFKFAFSPQAIENQLGMARNSCHGAVKRLEELGYLVPRENSNIYDFYECSQTIKTMDRSRLVESEMLDFEKTSSPTAKAEALPLAKQDDFQF
jgi:hypothetical protein